jgi:hypothetical protein
MLQHCFDECPIDSHMIMENETRLTAEWDANRPFANLIQRATAVHEFSNDAGRPIADNKVMDCTRSFSIPASCAKSVKRGRTRTLPTKYTEISKPTSLWPNENSSTDKRQPQNKEDQS